MPPLSYEQLHYESRAETLREVASGDTGRVVRAVVGAALSAPDREWVEACAVALTNASDIEVRRAAILAIAHLARRFRQVSPEAVAEVINRAGHEEPLAGTVDDLRDDLAMFGVTL